MSTSRRTVLQGIAASPSALAMPMAALTATSADPIFAAIAKHAASCWHSEAASKIDDDALHASVAIQADVFDELAGVVPKTPAGLRALIEHLAALAEWNMVDGGEDIAQAYPSILEACRQLMPAADPPAAVMPLPRPCRGERA